MKVFKRVWRWVLTILAVVIILDAVAFFYILSAPETDLGKFLSRHEPVFKMLQRSELRSPLDTQASLRPQTRITVRYVEGDQYVALPEGHPVFKHPNLKAEIIGRNEETRNAISFSEADGWYQIEYSAGRGWVHPFVTKDFVEFNKQARAANTRAELQANGSIKPDPLAVPARSRTPTLNSILERRTKKLEKLFERFGSKELALLPTSADPERLQEALELMGDDVRQLKAGDFIVYYIDSNWGDTSGKLLRNLRQEYYELLAPVIADQEGALSNAFVFLMPDMLAYKQFYPAVIESDSAVHAGHYEGGLLAIHPNSFQGMSRYRTLVHEATHHYNYLLTRINNLEGLIWLDEGLATYFGFSRQLSDGSVHAGEFQSAEKGQLRAGAAALQGMLTPDSPEHRIIRWQRKLSRGASLDVSAFLNMKNADFYKGDIISNYTRSWLLIHFFLHGEEERLRPAFYELITMARTRRISIADFERIAAMSVAEFNSLWESYVRSL